MRATPQSAFRAPLNDMLGAEANVRLLRVLALARTPLAAGELARRAALGRTSIYPALESLERAGIVTFVGAGAQRQVALRTQHPLARPIVELFRAEEQRLVDLLAALGEVAKGLKPSPVGVWVEGLSHPLNDIVSCWVLGAPKTLTQLTDAFSQQLEPIEREFDVHVEVHGTTRSELAARVPPEESDVLDDAVVLAGAIPRSVRHLDEDSPKGHEEHDTRGRRLGIALAAKLKRDPGLVRAARSQIAERSKKASPGEQRELREWARILAMSPARVRRFLTDPGERATRLRQTLPALGILSPAERDRVLKARTDNEARQAVIAGRRR
ncbi:MAG TPA: helix-turn-helix domain-containing protein [Gemmatimonadaceae bacterium]